jgi:hypothetical protein
VKTFKSFAAISALLIILSSPTLAGQVDTPPVVKPPQPPHQETTVGEGTDAGSGTTADPLLETALYIVRTLLSVF